MKVGVARADLFDPMFAHEDRGVHVVNDVSSEMGHLRNDLIGDVGMPQCRDENAETR